MTDLKNKVLDFVKAQANPVPISDIAKGLGTDPTSTQKAVLELHKEGVLFRSVSKGKALFSVDNSKGEGLTPVQSGNARVARTLNAKLGGGPTPVEDTFLDDDEDMEHRPFDIKLTFKQGKRVQFKDYSIGVPDGFEYKTDVNGRDFVIWMPPTMDPDDLDPDGIPIMSPFVLMEVAQNDESPSEAIQMVQMKKAYAYTLASGILQQNLMGTVPVVLDTQNIAALYQKGLMSNYSVHLIFNDHRKVFTCRIDPTMEPSSDKETASFESALTSWIDMVKLAMPYPVRKPLDDPEFFKDRVSEGAVAEWFDYAADWNNQAMFLCGQAIQYEINKYNATHPVWSFTACRAKLLWHMEIKRNDYNRMMAEALNCVERHKGSCDPSAFSSLCERALEIASSDECAWNIDNDTIKLKTDAPKIRKRIEEISGISNHRPPQEESSSGQGAQSSQGKQQAAPAKSEAPQKKQINKQALQQSVGIVRDNLHKELEKRIEKTEQGSAIQVEQVRQRLVQLMQAEVDRCDRELAKTRAEVDALSGSLQSMGLFQFKQKSETKAKLEQLKQKIGQLEQASRNPDSGDIKKAKSELECAEKGLADIVSTRTKWEDAVEKACSEYERRVNLYIDYAEGKKMVLASSLGLTDWKEWELMQAVYSVAFFATIQDMRQQSYELSKIDRMKVASLVRRMVDKGFLTKTMSGGQYHFDADDPMPKQVVDDTGWDIKKPPVAPVFDSILSGI